MSNILIEASNITKVYDPDIFLKRGKNFYALDNVNFVLEEGDFTCIMGPSGSGKSTLLNCLSTLDSVTSGHIVLMGENTLGMNKDLLCEFRYEYLGFVFQNHNLIPYLSVFDNIATPALLANDKPKVLTEKVKQIAKDLEIEELLDKFPSECSGGECQRVAIARALINNPKILFCDEPTGNLDSKNSHKVLQILSQLNRKGTSIILVTHDAMIASYAKTLIYLYDGGIKTVIHKKSASQMDFFKKITEITTQDSLIKEFSNEAKIEPEVKTESKEEKDEMDTIYIHSKKKEFVSRQTVYMIIDGKPYDEDIAKKNTPLHIQGTKVHYRNQRNDDIDFDLSIIQEITIDLRAHFVAFGLFSQYVFQTILDLKSEEGTYLLRAKNQDDLIHIIQYFKELNIPVNDPRDIQGAYKKYPREYERAKFFQRTHKDLIAYDKADKINPLSGKKM